MSAERIFTARIHPLFRIAELTCFVFGLVHVTHSKQVTTNHINWCITKILGRSLKLRAKNRIAIIFVPQTQYNISLYLCRFESGPFNYIYKIKICKSPFTHIFTGILIFKGLTKRHHYKSFCVKGLNIVTSITNCLRTEKWTVFSFNSRTSRTSFPILSIFFPGPSLALKISYQYSIPCPKCIDLTLQLLVPCYKLGRPSSTSFIVQSHLTFKDETQTASFKDPVRTAL
jgi:hypothetical protein